jgi:hypothetical protein
MWKELCDGDGVKLQISPVESHNSLGYNERMHAPLREIFLKIQEDVPGISDELTLRLAVKALNDTSGPDGLVPTLLVYGILPQQPMLQ